MFDRGLQSRKTYDLFTEKNIIFVGRIKTSYKCDIELQKEIPSKPPNASLRIIKDIIGVLQSRESKKTKSKYRIITGIIEDSREEICFVTNYLNADAYDIATIYKQRWEIEIFFKFLKQHLNLNHLLSRNQNGIKVMIYMTMILAILILAYKKLNKIKGYKIAKLRFEIELDSSIIKEIVLLYGGNPNKAAHLWNSS